MITGNNALKIQLLIDYLYLVVHSDTSYQIFIELTGPGKSGKSTFMTIAEA
jgi:phage/plasmid-associated DNA primase